MIVGNFNELPNGGAEVEIELTGRERVMIKQFYGWKRLTHKRIQSFVIEALENYMEMK